ncbi:MAG: hypothetical protein NC324_01685 [Bacteroides sp.]|nr:hypothetical protein [Bacteroides sp.]
MKRIILLCLLVSVVFVCHGQTASQIKADKRYVWAEATASNLRKADEEALQDLMSQISYSISVDGYTRVSNSQAGNSAQGGVDFNQIVKTYSMATLNNTKRLVEESTNRKGETFVKVMRFVLRDEIDRIFESRKAKAADFTQIAHKDLERLEIDNALRYYYWALALVQSLPYPEQAEVPDTEGKRQKADIYLPRCINEVLTSLQAGLDGKEGNTYRIGFRYKGKKVSSLDFSYFDGMDWSVTTGVIDGMGLLELRPAYDPEDIKIRYEYQYFGEAQVDKEVQQVLDAVAERHFPKGGTRVSLKKGIQDEKTAQTVSSQTPSAGVSKEEQAIYAKKIDLVLSAIKKQDYAGMEKLFTKEGWDVFNRLIHYGNARIISTPAVKMEKMDGYVYGRAVPMQFAFSRDRKFSENVVFVFDAKSHLIDNVQFGLSQVAEGDILSNPAWKEESKLVLRNFLENYKTAYALKNIGYLEQVFADDALIITGKTVMKREGDAETGYRTNKYVELTRHDKVSYLKRLRQVFAGQEFINIKFANNEVVKMGKGGEIYGIQIKQDYFSASYGDSGYLFVLVDVNNPNEPVIHVRAWQEAPDPKWGLIGPATF